jgi:hypothetical protein
VPDTFVSYSRQDQELADHLVAHLKEHRIDPWIDRTGIPGGARWRDELEWAITNSDSLVVVATAASVESPFVREEVTRGVDLGKPLVPLVACPVSTLARLHPALSDYQWILLDDDERTKAFDEVLDAVRQDHAWRRQHSELQRQALDWQAGQGDLMGPAALERVEQWEASADCVRRRPTELEREYIATSRTHGHRSREQAAWRLGAAQLRSTSRALVAALAVFALMSMLPIVATASRAFFGYRRRIVFAFDIVPAIVNSFLFLVVAALFLAWLAQAIRNATIADAELASGPSAASLLVPVSGLWVPRRVVSRVATASGAPSSGLLRSWWAAWIAMVLTGVVLSHFKWWLDKSISDTTFSLRHVCSGAVSSSAREDCYDGVTPLEAVFTVVDGVRVSATILALAVVLTVTRAQERRGRDEVEPPPSDALALPARVRLIGAAAVAVFAVVLVTVPISPPPRSDGTEIQCGSVFGGGVHTAAHRGPSRR